MAFRAVYGYLQGSRDSNLGSALLPFSGPGARPAVPSAVSPRLERPSCCPAGREEGTARGRFRGRRFSFWNGNRLPEGAPTQSGRRPCSHCTSCDPP